ncbi:2,3-bisphosphoglycerate-independent phosphoglycerate mutase [Candidatus Bathyarchaeota archaeon]|nr:2,3-bisphosphoglycerate-independent phosphoglycerate mutase [Candidatus Bathyarchaeota archaeon]
MMDPSHLKTCVLVVLDGMADLEIPAMDGKTPVEAARTPILDLFAKEGKVGYMHSIGYWKVGGSDTSHMALLGYDPWSIYTGRGPIEVAGTGVNLQEGDVSIRCNYCTVGDGMHILDRTAGYVRDGIEELANAINDGVHLSDPSVKAEFRNSQDYRCVVYFRGPGISASISDMDPSYDIIIDAPMERDKVKENPRIIDCKPRDNSKEAIHMAELLNEWVEKSHDILKKHPVNKRREEQGKPPANCIMPRGAGETPMYEPFHEKWHLKGACVAGTGLIKGLGNLMGMRTPDVPGATGYVDSDLLSKARVTVELLEEGMEFILVHVESIDEVSHDGNVKLKIEMLEKGDEMLEYIAEHVPDNTIICVLSDHTTSCEKGDHTADPSPLVIWSKDSSIQGDGLQKFSEHHAYKGSLKHVEGKDLMPILLNFMNRHEQFGA